LKKLLGLALAFLLNPVGSALAQFVIPQGPLTVTATENVYIADLDLNLLNGQTQDMGALYTQVQLNESGDLKHAYEHGKVTFDTVGTAPNPVVVSLGTVASSFIIPQGPLLITAPAGPDDVYIADLDLKIPAGTAVDMGELYTQNQLNTSNDLKSAIQAGKVSTGAGTVTPIADPIEISGGTLTGDLDMGGYDILNLGLYPSVSDQFDDIGVATTTLKAEIDGVYVTTGTFGPIVNELNLSTAALEANKVDRAGDTMTGDLNMSDNQIINISSGTVNGSWDVAGRINGILWFDPVDTVSLKLLACPLKPCMVYNTDLDDVFTSTGIAVGQWRNTRTGAGPGYDP
jgi:hypothetical protein